MIIASHHLNYSIKQKGRKPRGDLPSTKRRRTDSNYVPPIKAVGADRASQQH